MDLSYAWIFQLVLNKRTTELFSTKTIYIFSRQQFLISISVSAKLQRQFLKTEVLINERRNEFQKTKVISNIC